MPAFALPVFSGAPLRCLQFPCTVTYYTLPALQVNRPQIPEMRWVFEPRLFNKPCVSSKQSQESGVDHSSKRLILHAAREMSSLPSTVAADSLTSRSLSPVLSVTKDPGVGRFWSLEAAFSKLPRVQFQQRRDGGAVFPLVCTLRLLTLAGTKLISEKRKAAKEIFHRWLQRGAENSRGSRWGKQN